MAISKRLIKNSGIALIALSTLGCGHAAGPAPAQIGGAQTSCGAGQVLINNACVSAQQSLNDFAAACTNYINMGSFDPYGKTCTISLVPTVGVANYMGTAFGPTLTRDNPSGPYAIQTKIPVKTGDVVSVAWVSGAYGSNPPSTSSYLGGLFTVTTWNSASSCSEVDMNGISNSAQGTYNGLPAGLVGGDGTNVFFLGTSGSATIAANGQLLLGINVPSSTQYLCGSFGATVTIKYN